MILGGNGVFGVQMTRYLLLHVPEAYVICVGRNPEKPPAFSLHRGIDDSRYEYHQIHIVYEPERLMDLLDAKRPGVIVNIAAQGEGAASWRYSWRYFETNAVALARIVEPLIGVPWLEKWIQMGSSEVYGSVMKPATEDSPIRSSSPYSASKAAADLYLLSVSRSRNFPMNILRPSNAYGPGQQLHRIIPKTIMCALLGQKLPLQGGGEARKSYIHTDDLSRAIYLIAEKAVSGTVYNVGPKQSIPIRILVEMVCQKVGVPFSDVVQIAPDRIGQDAQYLLDSSRIASDLGWQPVIDLDQGLDDVIAWAKRYLDFLKSQPTGYVFRA